MINDIGEGIFSNAYSLEPPSIGDLLFCFRGEEILVKGEADNYTLPTYGELEPPCHRLFTLEGVGCYKADTVLKTPEGYTYFRAGDIARTNPERKLGFSIITALQLHRWETARAFCGKCGSKTELSQIERAVLCPECGHIEYPKICPAIIVTITHNGKLLMAAGKNNPTRFALIAGFVEIGETFEETVKREALEEVGVKVTNVKYFKNQPWGFSDSQMIGFTAELDGDDETITVQESEISAAKWVEAKDVPLPASDISISSELIWHFLEQHGITKEK